MRYGREPLVLGQRHPLNAQGKRPAISSRRRWGGRHAV